MSAELESLPVAGKYYGDKATGYDEKRLSKDAFHNDQFVIQNFLKAVVTSGHNVLDVACGTNRISDFIRSLGGKYHGIDISSDMVELAREKDPQSDIRVADARNIPHPDATFDLVMTIKFLKWLPDDTTLEAVVKEISRVMKPGALAMLHQKVEAGAQAAPGIGLRRLAASILKRRSEKAIKTRAVGEDVFLGFCRDAGLDLKFVSMTSPAGQTLRKSRVNVFYVLEKRQ